MNKPPLLLTLLAILATPAWAAKFNPDAMKTMQDQGLKVADEAAGLAPLKAAGKCLSPSGDNAKAGSALTVGECKDKSGQRWRFDGAGRLMNGDGLCLGLDGKPDQIGAKGQLADCASAPNWKHDEQGRIVSSDGKCLEAAGKGVQLKECGAGEGQVWR